MTTSVLLVVSGRFFGIFSESNRWNWTRIHFHGGAGRGGPSRATGTSGESAGAEKSRGKRLLNARLVAVGGLGSSTGWEQPGLAGSGSRGLRDKPHDS